MDIQVSISVPGVELAPDSHPLADSVPLDLTLRATVSVPVDQLGCACEPTERYTQLYRRWGYHHDVDGGRLVTSVAGESVIRLMAALTEEIIKIAGGNTPAERFISKSN